MGLQFVFGGSGSGKSTLVFQKVIEQSQQDMAKHFFLMVPDQFTMYTQKEICEMHPRGGIMNIDVLSFSRLIHRIADEVGQKERVMLDDTGKNLVLRKVAADVEEELVLFQKKLKRPGYIHEVKSMLSEFYQYDISPDELEDMADAAKGRGLLPYKLRDLKLLYEGFQKYIQEKYIVTEEALDELCHMIPQSHILRNAVLVFDGFTGFTPIQNRVILELMHVAQEVIITLDADNGADLHRTKQHLFGLSAGTYHKLSGLARKEDITVRQNIYLTKKPVNRYLHNPELAFLEAHLFRYDKAFYPKKTQMIRIEEAETLVSEVQQMCIHIKRLVRKQGYCYRDIAVVTGDLSGYASIVEKEFLRYKIPLFLDQNRSVLHQPAVEYVKGALQLVRDNFSYESVFRFLRTGMTALTMDEIDRLDLYVMKMGIHGRKQYGQLFARGEEAGEMNALREKLMEEIAPLLVRCKTAKEYTMQVYSLCDKNSLQKKCRELAEKFTETGDLVKAKEFEKIYPALMDLLDQIYGLIGEDPLSLDEFIQIFEAGVSEIQIGTIPQNVDQVVVGDMERTRLKKIKALFFLGVNDGVIPARGGNGGLLSDMEREYLIESGRELAPSPRQKLFEQQLYLYQNMTKPAEYLFLSYAKVDSAGKTRLPSYLIRVMTGLFPKLHVQTETEENEGFLAEVESAEDGLDDFAGLLRKYREGSLEKTTLPKLRVLQKVYDTPDAEKIREAAFYRYEPGKLSRQAADSLYAERNQGSVSRLELFASCAYAHFLRYGLELMPRAEYTFEAVDFGSVYHGVLELFERSLKEDGISLRTLTEEEMEQRLWDAFSVLTKEYGETILYSSARNERRIRQMHRLLLRSVRTMQYQMQKGSFEPAYFEQKFRMKGAFPLVGKIDRIDIRREDDEIYLKVMDYKSGRKQFSLDDVYYGLSMQLPVYMNAAVSFLQERYPQTTIIPAAMLYYRLQKPIIEIEGTKAEEEIEVEIRKQMKPDGLLLGEDCVLTMLDQGFTTDSDVMRVGRKKDGSFKAASQVISQEDLGLLLSYTQKKAEQMMQQMAEGEIAVTPLKTGNHTSCDFCEYREVCRMDERIDGYRLQELTPLTDEERKEAMERAVYGGSEEGHRDEK